MAGFILTGLASSSEFEFGLARELGGWSSTWCTYVRTWIHVKPGVVCLCREGRQKQGHLSACWPASLAIHTGRARDPVSKQHRRQGQILKVVPWPPYTHYDSCGARSHTCVHTYTEWESKIDKEGIPSWVLKSENKSHSVLESRGKRVLVTLNYLASPTMMTIPTEHFLLWHIT